jgi:hypothetical protein
MTTKRDFDEFVHVLGYLLLARNCDDEVAHCLASYFWERLSNEYKSKWKRKSRDLEREKGKKIKGVWMFAKKVIKALREKDDSFFEYIWKWMRH